MHEAGIAQYLIEIATHHLQREPHGPVRLLHVRIGELAGVNPDALDFAFEALRGGTAVDGARLAIERVPLTVDCGACGTRSAVTDYTFRCGACAAEAVTVATGRELQFVSIDTDDLAEGETGASH